MQVHLKPTKSDSNFISSILGGSVVNNLPGKQKTWVQYLSQKDRLEKEMAIHSSVLALEMPWREKPCGLQSTGVAKSQLWSSNWIAAAVLPILSLKFENHYAYISLISIALHSLGRYLTMLYLSSDLVWLNI